jgi:hypothetical protein
MTGAAQIRATEGARMTVDFSSLLGAPWRPGLRLLSARRAPEIRWRLSAGVVGDAVSARAITDLCFPASQIRSLDVEKFNASRRFNRHFHVVYAFSGTGNGRHTDNKSILIPN